jgi:hypothetical protein
MSGGGQRTNQVIVDVFRRNPMSAYTLAVKVDQRNRVELFSFVNPERLFFVRR